MSKLIGTIFKAFNVLVVLLYLSACLIPFLPPGKYWMFAVAGLMFPLLCILVFCFFCVWLMVKSRWALLSLIALVLSLQQITATLGLNIQQPFNYTREPATLRVFQWNVSSWGESNKSQKPQTNYGPLTIELIKKQQADVLCLQEFWERKDWYSQSLNTAAFKEMGYPYSYFVRSYLEGDKLKTGVVIISKYPIVDTATFSYGENDFAEHLIYADILFHEQRIRVFTTHLQSVRFNNGEYSAVNKVRQKDKSGLTKSKTIVHKLKYAYHFREAEADMAHEKISESPYPSIVCGDFNDVPNSYTYFTVRGNLQDAFVKKGTGLGRTFQYLSPTLRIDYILADKKFEVMQYNRYKVPFSDHYPIVADLKLNGVN